MKCCIKFQKSTLTFTKFHYYKLATFEVNLNPLFNLVQVRYMHSFLFKRVSSLKHMINEPNQWKNELKESHWRSFKTETFSFMLYVCKNRSWNIFLRLSLSFSLFSDSWNWKTSQVQTGPVRVPNLPSFKHLSFITLTFHVTYWQTQPTLWMNSADRFVSFVNLWTPMLSICTKQKLTKSYWF